MLTIAYIDPGTGAMVLQMIMAIVVGAGIYFRKALKRVFGLFGGGSSKPKSNDDDSKHG